MKCAQLLTAAAMLIACGCSESSLGPTNPDGSTLPQSSEPVAITGTVEVSPSAIRLRVETGTFVELVGSEARRLGPLDGAQVQLLGTWGYPVTSVSSALGTDIPPYVQTFEVETFQVLAVGGRPAMDGVLEEESGRYYLKIGTGDIAWIEQGPPNFVDYVGKRIWVTGSLNNPPLRFGVIN
jgi:hypothetical protein